MATRRRPTGDLPPVFLGREAVEEGLLTVRQLRGPLVQRIIHGVYRPAWVPATHELACQAAALVLPGAACVTGRSAATFRGVRLARADDPVEVCVPVDLKVPSRAGMSVRTVRGSLAEPTVVDGVPLADPLRVGFDLAARVGLADGVAHLDAVSRAGLLDPAAFRVWLNSRHDGDVVGVRRAAELIDPRAESLPESRTRVILIEAGFAVVPQYVVRAGADVLARVDLALPDLRIAIEYDGLWHSLREQLARDRYRLNLLNGAGWMVVHVTSQMLRSPPDLVAAVNGAIAVRRAA